MPATLTIAHPDISTLSQTFVTTAAHSGESALAVQNASDFSVNNYVVIGKYGTPSSQIRILISNPPDINTLNPGSLDFGYPTNTSVTQIPFNDIKIYRSTTGTGGTYALLATIPIQVDQDFSSYTDFTAVSPYSYKYTFYNSGLNVESDFSSEMPFDGFPLYSLNSIVRRTLTLFTDNLGEFITQQSVADWSNEFLSMLNKSVTDSDTGPFVNFSTFVPGNNDYTDISNLSIESVFFVQYSVDGSTQWRTIDPMDSRVRPNPVTSDYSWNLIGNNFFVNQNFPSSYTVRLWYFTQQTPLQQESDTLPAIYRSYSDVFVDYCMMRANEQSRRLSESAVYYNKKVFGSSGDGQVSGSYKRIVDDIRSSINQGNKAMATTWLGGFTNPF